MLIGRADERTLDAPPWPEELQSANYDELFIKGGIYASLHALHLLVFAALIAAPAAAQTNQEVADQVIALAKAQWAAEMANASAAEILKDMAAAESFRGDG